MKNLILFCFLAFPFLMFSQSRSSLDFTISPDLTYRILKFDVNNPLEKMIVETNDKREKMDINLHLGFHFNHKLSSKIWLKTGLELAKIGRKRVIENLQWGNQNDNGTFNPNIIIDPNLPNSVTTYNGYYLINLPIIMRYEFSTNRVVPYFEVGFVPAYQLSNYSKSVFDKGNPTSSNNSFNKMTALIHWGFGANYTVNEKFQFFVQPTIRYQIISPTEPIKEHLYTIGIELGARMSL
jgi:hypothetical protein